MPHILYQKSAELIKKKKNPLHSSLGYATTTSFIEHLSYNIYGKGVNGIVKVVQTSTFLNGHITEKQVFWSFIWSYSYITLFYILLGKVLSIKIVVEDSSLLSLEIVV